MMISVQKQSKSRSKLRTQQGLLSVKVSGVTGEQTPSLEAFLYIPKAQVVRPSPQPSDSESRPSPTLHIHLPPSSESPRLSACALFAFRDNVVSRVLALDSESFGLFAELVCQSRAGLLEETAELTELPCLSLISAATRSSYLHYIVNIHSI